MYASTLMYFQSSKLFLDGRSENVHGITDMPVSALSVSIKLYQTPRDSAPQALKVPL